MLQRVLSLIPGFKVLSHPRVAVVRLSGVIGAGGRFGSGLSLAREAGTLEAAFSAPRLQAVALVINSPGGAPAQSHLIVKRIRALTEEKGLPVFAFVEDVAASGGYMLACAADEIFADESSIVGSIGVISAGFGFEGLIDKLGIERRVHTAGRSKAMLDPFRPEDPEDLEHLKGIQEDVHAMFKDLVKTRRGPRLKGDDTDLFEGAFWTGREAKRRGLIDDIGDLNAVMKRRFGSKVRLIPFAGDRPFWRRSLGFQGRQRSAPEGGLLDGVLERLSAAAVWARFGL